MSIQNDVEKLYRSDLEKQRQKKKQMQEKISLEIIYEFLILNAEEMEVTRIDDVNIFKEEEFIELVDNAIKNINSKTKLNLKRISKKIYLGKNN